MCNMTREEIGRIIQESRISAGLTQSKVAKELGRPQQTIASWESGKSQPDANTLFDLFRVLGRSVDEAFGFNVESFNVTARERAYIEKYRILDPHGKDAVDRLLETEYSRCIVEQNLEDYKNRLLQLTDAMNRLQQETHVSDEKTLDDLAREIRAFKFLLGEAMYLESEMDRTLGTLENPAYSHTGGPQASPQEDEVAVDDQGALPEEDEI